MPGGDNSSWRPWFFGRHVHDALGDVLAEFDLRPTKRKGGARPEIEYRYSHVRLTFWWDRQEMDGMLWPLDPMVRAESNDRQYALTDIFNFLGLTEPDEGFFLQLRTPERFHSHLQRCASYLRECRDFLMGDADADAYAGLRRFLEIRQLAYDWKRRKAYKDSERFTAETLKEIRRNAVRWWQEGDFRSVVQVLEIIEGHLTEEERELLAQARSRMQPGGNWE